MSNFNTLKLEGKVLGVALNDRNQTKFEKFSPKVILLSEIRKSSTSPPLTPNSYPAVNRQPWFPPEGLVEHILLKYIN